MSAIGGKADVLADIAGCLFMTLKQTSISSAYGNSDHNKAATAMPIKAVAPQPAQTQSAGRAAIAPMAFGFVTINIITAMMGAATIPLMTAVQTSN